MLLSPFSDTQSVPHGVRVQSLLSQVLGIPSRLQPLQDLPAGLGLREAGTRYVVALHGGGGRIVLHNYFQ